MKDSFCFISGDKFQEIMTSEEKQKLYDAIGYQENIDTVFPVEVSNNHLSSSSNFNPFQSAYWKYYTTETALILILDNIYNSVDFG